MLRILTDVVTDYIGLHSISKSSFRGDVFVLFYAVELW